MIIFFHLTLKLSHTTPEYQQGRAPFCVKLNILTVVTEHLMLEHSILRTFLAGSVKKDTLYLVILTIELKAWLAFNFIIVRESILHHIKCFFTHCVNGPCQWPPLTLVDCPTQLTLIFILRYLYLSVE